MTVTLSPETQQLIADRMTLYGYASADDLIRDMLDASTAADVDGGPADDDPELLAALAEAEAQADRGETRPLTEVRDELRRRFGVADL